MSKILFWSLNFTKSSFFIPKLLKIFYFMSLNFIKSLFFVPKLLKKSFFFHLYFFPLNYYKKKNYLQSLRIKKQLFKI